ncbi:MAG: molybdenum ABC transporter ATP-binding protein [Cyclobacteriaceae bacterium]|nr:molybdenum ABC transporter ATP-binding protein [Cyclobacteriaceae bacterium]
MSVLKANFLLSRPGFTLDIQCEIETQVTGIFGPSGAGKTSFLHVLAGLETPDHGSVFIQDHEVFNASKKLNLPPEKRKIGYVFQEGRLFPHLNVAQNLKYGLKQHLNLSKEVADLLKISDIISKKVSQISGGQAQRVAIGRALLSSPDILVLDEPFSALDKNLRQHIISLLKPLIKKFNIPMLVISHDLSDLLMLSDQLMIIHDGKCAGQGSYYDLIGQKEAFVEMSKSGLINSIELKVDYIDKEKGLLMLSHDDCQICAESRLNGNSFFDEKQVTIFLRPEDVTLALHRIEDISIQNQIEGKIEKLITTDNKVLCVIDHGFKLIAEVTLATKQKMKLEEGAKIWSLFKAAAIKMNSRGAVNSSELY